MIWESSDWKQPLLKSAKWLRSVKFSDRTQERTFVRIEKELFIGFYSIRKLLETLKISDSTKKLTFEVEWYSNKEPVHDLNWHHLDRLYDLSSRHLETRDMGFLCNQFIHSYVFVVAGRHRDRRCVHRFRQDSRQKSLLCLFAKYSQSVSGRWERLSSKSSIHSRSRDGRN